MATATSAAFVSVLRRHQLLEPNQLEEVEQKLAGQFPEPKALVRELLQRGWLTALDAVASGRPASGGRQPPEGTLDTGQRWAKVVDPANTMAEVPSRARPRRLAVPLMLGGVAVAGVLVAVWLILGRSSPVAQSRVKAPTPTAPAPAPLAAHIVKVQANQPWQDSGVDVFAGQAVTLAPEGHWRKGQELVSVAGLAKAPRDRAVLAAAPVLCLLARIGDAAEPTALTGKQTLTPRRNGRLFLQANDVDLSANRDALKVTITGGQPSETKMEAPPLLPIQASDRELGPLLARSNDPAIRPEKRCDEVLAFCAKYLGLPAYQRAATLLPKLPRWENSIGMKLAPIAPGKFWMGSPDNEPGRDGSGSEGPQHEVTLTRPFYMGVYPVTVGQFRAFVKDAKYQTEAEKSGGASRRFPDGKWANDPKASWLNPGFEQTDDHPVVCVSWNDAQAFCAWLSKKEGKQYGLPTEAQWEYSCRAGSSTKYYFGNKDAEAGDYFWHNGNSGWKTHPVGEKKPNAWGLYDMGGNVRNWCQDIYDKDYYKVSPKEDPAGPSAGGARVRRGGRWYNALPYCRSAFRHSDTPSSRYDDDGFRVVLAPASLGRVGP